MSKLVRNALILCLAIAAHSVHAGEAAPVWEPVSRPALRVIEGTMKSAKPPWWSRLPIKAFGRLSAVGTACAILLDAKPLGDAEWKPWMLPICFQFPEYRFFPHPDGAAMVKTHWSSDQQTMLREIWIMPTFSIDDGLPGSAPTSDAISDARTSLPLPTESWPPFLFALTDGPDPDDSNSEENSEEPDEETAKLEHSRIILIDHFGAEFSMDDFMAPEEVHELARHEYTYITIQHGNKRPEKIRFRGVVTSFQPTPLYYRGVPAGNDGNFTRSLIFDDFATANIRPEIVQKTMHWLRKGKPVMLLVLPPDQAPFFALVNASSLNTQTVEDIQPEDTEPLGEDMKRRNYAWLTLGTAHMRLVQSMSDLTDSRPKFDTEGLLEIMREWGNLQDQFQRISIERLHVRSNQIADRFSEWAAVRSPIIQSDITFRSLQETLNHAIMAHRTVFSHFDEKSYAFAFKNNVTGNYRFFGYQLSQIASIMPDPIQSPVDDFLRRSKRRLDQTPDLPRTAMRELIGNTLPSIQQDLRLLRQQLERNAKGLEMDQGEQRHYDLAREIVRQLDLYVQMMLNHRFL